LRFLLLILLSYRSAPTCAAALRKASAAESQQVWQAATTAGPDALRNGRTIGSAALLTASQRF
jgi:hypothetical protein